MDSAPYENHLFNIRAVLFCQCFAPMTKIRWDLPELRHHTEQALQHTGVPVTEDEIRFACADLAAGQLVFKGPDPDSWLVWAPVPPPGA